MVKTQFCLSVSTMDLHLPGLIHVAKQGMDPYEAWRACMISCMLERDGHGPPSPATKVSVTPRPPVKVPAKPPTKDVAATTTKTQAAPAKTAIETKAEKPVLSPQKPASSSKVNPRDPPESPDEFEC
jgi:hypothetical protein